MKITDITVIRSIIPVSYTHLDVYKRQVYIKELSAPAGYNVDKTVYPLTIKAGETATSVSYTHLDVYKRQACTDVIDPFFVEVIRSCSAPISVCKVG